MTITSARPDVAAQLRRFAPYVRAIARRRVQLGRTLGTSLDAEDLANAALLALWQVAAELDAAGWPTAWVARRANFAMFAIEATDRSKWGRAQAVEPEDLAAMATAPEDEPDGFDELLDLMTPGVRRTMAARFGDGLTLAAIAAAEGVSTSRIGQRIDKELGRLRKALRPENAVGG